jgi:alanyl-tRNA synthetase
MLSGEAAFRLYDTFGVPYDFIEDTAATQGVTVDREAYDRAMEGQRDKARAKSAFGKGEAKIGLSVDSGSPDLTAIDATREFVGYESTHQQGLPVVALWDAEGNPVELLKSGSSGYVTLPTTPFYLEAGGQVSDTGRIVSEATGASAMVDGLVRIRTGMPRAHHVQVDAGTLRLRDLVTAEVDATIRDATRRNHTATHLLHAALRQVLGTHVKQAGSLVDKDHLRFDFVHFQPVTREELSRIERIVNEQIYRNTTVSTDVRSTDEAIASGAMALFGEKYGDRVRVVSVPGFSVELCGGTHVRATGDIGMFVITGESGVAAGVRRIEAITGAASVEWAQEQRAALDAVIGALHVNPDQAVETIEKLQADVKRLGREATQLKTKLALGASSGGGSGAAADDAIDVSGVTLARRKVADLDKDALRNLADSLKAKIKSGVVILASANDGKVQIVVAVTPDLTNRIKAGQVVKEIAPIVGGGGGGRPDFAEAGGKDPSKIDEMLDQSRPILERMLTKG